LAAFSGYFFQRIFRREDLRTIKRNEIYSFNEATAFIGVLIETLVSRFPQLSIPSLQNEQNIYQTIENDIQRGLQVVEFRGTFKNILPLEVPNASEFIDKMPNIGQHIHLTLAFYRLRESMIQSAYISTERTMLIKQFIETPKIDQTWVLLRCGEILDRTKKLIACEELILDAAYYISTKLPALAKELKSSFQKISNEDVKANFMEPNPHYEALLAQVNKMLDSDQEFKERFLHMRHQEIAGAYVKTSS
jgi:hypothetical protein